MKIFIVEDEDILLKVLKEKFERESYQVALATDGEMAFSLIQKFQPDMILLDLLLPKKSGFEVLEQIKSDPALKTTPVIVLSNLGQDEDIKKALQMGADDHLVKTHHPINEVLDRVKERLMSKSR